MIVKYLLKAAMLGSSWVMYLLLILSVASIGAMYQAVPGSASAPGRAPWPPTPRPSRNCLRYPAATRCPAAVK